MHITYDLSNLDYSTMFAINVSSTTDKNSIYPENALMIHKHTKVFYESVVSYTGTTMVRDKNGALYCFSNLDLSLVDTYERDLG